MPFFLFLNSVSRVVHGYVTVCACVNTCNMFAENDDTLLSVQMPLQRRRRRSQSREDSDDYKRVRLADAGFYAYSRDEHPAAFPNMRCYF